MSKIANVNFKLDYESKKVGRERRIPFEVFIDPFFSDSNIRYLKGIKNKIQNGEASFNSHELLEDAE
jgi:DNA-damage-inducible protein J